MLSVSDEMHLRCHMPDYYYYMLTLSGENLFSTNFCFSLLGDYYLINKKQFIALN